MSKPKSKSQQEVFIEEEKGRASRYRYTGNDQDKKATKQRDANKRSWPAWVQRNMLQVLKRSRRECTMKCETRDSEGARDQFGVWCVMNGVPG